MLMRSRLSVVRRPAWLTRLALALTAALAVGACGRHPIDTDPPPDANEPTELTVNNQHWLDVIVYVTHDGQTTRVGTVTATSTAVFNLAPWMLGESRLIQLIGDPVGEDGNIGTELLKIQPGQTIEWRLESQLARSSVSVY
jgi:hypothetical protein